MKKTTVLAIGRWMPIHIGHKNFLINLANNYDMLIVGIGSCYENGTLRNCIPAVEREQLLHKIFAHENIRNYKIVHLPDRPTFDEWFSDVYKLCQKYSVTHFCTGNKEDILDIMKKNNLDLGAKLINPEDNSNFPFHATDIRNAILKNEFEKLDSMIPSEIKERVITQLAQEIKRAAEGNGQEFIPGRQTVDMVFLVNDKEKSERYLLIGKRCESKIDFPGYYAIPGGGICEFETPLEAVIRCFYIETGIDISVEDNSTDPAVITIKNVNGDHSGIYFTGIYASHDKSINGTLGGGSQCFAVIVDGNTDEISQVLHSEHDMVQLNFVNVNDIHKIDFAYDQKRMVYNALQQLGIACDKGELLACFDGNGNLTDESVSRYDAHKKGVIHGASHIFVYKWVNRELYILLQRRSYNKDSFPGYLDISSAGHIEYGMDFCSTAVKELSEELGITVEMSDLRELFKQRIYQTNVFHGKTFIDNEFNTVYALEMDCEIESIKIQPEEVSEVLWMNANDILAALDNGTSTICANSEEVKKAISILQNDQI